MFPLEQAVALDTKGLIRSKGNGEVVPLLETSLASEIG